MEFFIHFAYPWLLYFLIPTILFLAMLRVRYYKPLVYKYSLTSLLDKAGYEEGGNFQKIVMLLRIIILLSLALLLAKPRIIDFQSKIQGEGVDMVLVLDVSNSMNLNDDPRDERSRLEVAKQEAIKFIDKREHDPIGLVIFGRDAVSRCPLTLDKNILKEIIKDTTIGTVDGRGTLLNTGIIMAANRLKDSKGTSKVMVVLTDGTPFEDDKTPEQAVAVAKKFGIKIYTIGIGQDGIVYVPTPFGMQPMNGVNKELLHYIADQTGGRFFEAKKPEDMKSIYNTIDRLEKAEYETNIFTHYYDIFKPFLLAASIVAVVELLLTSFVWFTV
jgi:Ca-activated chloride channel homolog